MGTYQLPVHSNDNIGYPTGAPLPPKWGNQKIKLNMERGGKTITDT